MSSKKRSRTQPRPRWARAVALVPLAVLSAAWTASVAGAGSTTVLADASITATLPDGSSVPTEAIQAPASVSSADASSASDDVPDKPVKNARQIVQTVSTSGIPAAALAAYQRAETVINSADESCQLTWQLVAAIGRVESNHGRFGGNSLDGQGVARPGIFGIPLDGRKGTSRISDTDAGQYDADSVWDRAVGPMQFIPSTWSVVGVDADGDGKRDPQDIDDAALATAVYLCSGADDLSTLAGQRTAVYRYNHSSSYVDLVLSIMDAYLDGEFTSMPNGVTSAGYLVPEPESAPGTGRDQDRDQGPKGTVDQSGPGDGPTQQPTQQPSQEPTKPPADDGDDDGGGKDGPKLPTKPSLPPLPSTSIEPVDEILSRAQAIVQCTLEGYIDNILKRDDPFDKCVERYMS